MPNLIYEGIVNVYDKKADGSALIIGKGDRAGEPYYKLSFKVEGQYVNLMDFDAITKGQKGSYHVEYYQKFLPNGDPDLYNDKPQYQLADIYPQGAQGQQNGPPTPQQGQSTSKGDFDPNLSRRQTAANDATRIVAALMHDDPAVSLAFWTTWADGIDNWLQGKEAPNEFDAHMAAAQDKLDAKPYDPANDPSDDDVPFG